MIDGRATRPRRVLVHDGERAKTATTHWNDVKNVVLFDPFASRRRWEERVSFPSSFLGVIILLSEKSPAENITPKSFFRKVVCCGRRNPNSLSGRRCACAGEDPPRYGGNRPFDRLSSPTLSLWLFHSHRARECWRHFRTVQRKCLTLHRRIAKKEIASQVQWTYSPLVVISSFRPQWAN